MILIEFAGALGAGKTVLHRHAREAMRERGITCQILHSFADSLVAKRRGWQTVARLLPVTLEKRLRKRLVEFALRRASLDFARLHPELWRLVRASQEGRDISRRDRTRVWSRFRSVAGGNLLARQAKPDDAMVLFSEGLVQRVTMLFTSESEVAPKELIHRYLDLLPPPDLLVWVRCPLEVSLERSIRRDLPFRFRGKSPEDVRRFAGFQFDAIEDSVTYLRSKGWPVLEIENVNLEESQSRLRDALLEFWSSQTERRSRP